MYGSSHITVRRVLLVFTLVLSTSGVADDYQAVAENMMNELSRLVMTARTRGRRSRAYRAQQHRTERALDLFYDKLDVTHQNTPPPGFLTPLSAADSRVVRAFLVDQLPRYEPSPLRRNLSAAGRLALYNIGAIALNAAVLGNELYLATHGLPSAFMAEGGETAMLGHATLTGILTAMPTIFGLMNVGDHEAALRRRALSNRALLQLRCAVDLRKL
jgi:hypothetical protein